MLFCKHNSAFHELSAIEGEAWFYASFLSRTHVNAATLRSEAEAYGKKQKRMARKKDSTYFEKKQVLSFFH